MADEIVLCAAAFFQSKGKGVVTENEFLMDISMNKRWMPYGDAEKLLAALLKDGIAGKENGYIRPKFDVPAVDVPAGYRPAADLMRCAENEDTDIFHGLMSKASATGIDRKEFLSMCRNIQKKMNTEVEVAALMVLRDHGADVSGYIVPVYDTVIKR